MVWEWLCEVFMKHKDYYDDQYILDLSEKIGAVLPVFDPKQFTHDLIGQLDDKELFARFDLIVDSMDKHMGIDYSENIRAFYKMLGPELTKPEGCSVSDGGYSLLVDMGLVYSIPANEATDCGESKNATVCCTQ